MKKSIVIIILGCFAFGCSPTLYMPASKDAAEQEQLLKGRSLYVDHCSSCHNLHFPKEFSADQWKLHVSEMQKRAKITDDEKRLILNYLQSYKQ